MRRMARLIYSMQQLLRTRNTGTFGGQRTSPALVGRLQPLLAPLAAELQGALEDAVNAFAARKEVPTRHLRALTQVRNVCATRAMHARA